jgi:protein-tyrosine sulfotransferase
MDRHCMDNTLKPAFIMSCERSGSTVLRYIIDTHPDIISPGELHLGQLCHDLTRAVARTAGEACTSVDAEAKQAMTVAQVRGIVAGLMDAYTATKHKRLWCEKTTLNLDYIDQLIRVFPDARYICLYRHAMDVVHSCLEAGHFGFLPEHVAYVHQNPRNLISAMVQRWVDKTRELLAFERQHAAQCFRITYESFILDPAGALEPLFRFLGVAWDAQLLEAVFAVHHDQGDGDSKVRFATQLYNTSIGKGSSLSRDNIPARLLTDMNTLLEELGYPIVGPDWGHAPSPLTTMHAAPPAANHDIQQIFTHYLPQRLSGYTNGQSTDNLIYKVVVHGDGGGTWLIDLSQPTNQITVGDGAAHCTFMMSASDLIALMHGRLNAAEAWLQGKLHIAGDLTQAERFGRMLFGEQPHKA